MAEDQPSYTKPPTLLEFQGVGNADRMPYQHVTTAKVCRINTEVAISFYQMDFQAVVNRQLPGGEDADIRLMPVTKIVMPIDAFWDLKRDLDRMADKLGDAPVSAEDIAMALKAHMESIVAVAPSREEQSDDSGE